jgi:hypothetical protein
MCDLDNMLMFCRLLEFEQFTAVRNSRLVISNIICIFYQLEKHTQNIQTPGQFSLAWLAAFTLKFRFHWGGGGGGASQNRSAPSLLH